MRSLALAALLLVACSDSPLPSDFRLVYDATAVTYTTGGGSTLGCEGYMPTQVRGGPDYTVFQSPCTVDGDTISCVRMDVERITWMIAVSSDRSSAGIMLAMDHPSNDMLDCTGAVEATIVPIE